MMQDFKMIVLRFLEHTVRPFLVIALILLLAGGLLRPIETAAWSVVRAGQPETSLESLEGALGQGVVIGLFGGFRAILADFAWLKLYDAWSDKDRTALDAMLRLVTTLDPRPEFFWINGSRMIAYDVPAWRVRQASLTGPVPDARIQEIAQEQADQAFAFLEKARAYHPDSPPIALEIAQIYLNRLKDDTMAAEWFLKASELPDAPYYAARMHAELLRKQGKNEAAYKFLKQLYITLPDDDPYAQKGIVLERIRELETELKTPMWQRFIE